MIMYEIAECLKDNRNIQYLNLSWNNFKELSILNMRRQQLEMDAIYEMDIAQNLSKFMKYNQNLLHVDLSNTGLTKRMMMEFGGTLRKARSLMCLHLSGNPGIISENRAGKEDEDLESNDMVHANALTKIIQRFQQQMTTREALKEIEKENRQQVTMEKKKGEKVFHKKDSLDLVKSKIEDESILKLVNQLEYNNYRTQKAKDNLKSIKNYINLKDYLFRRVVCVP